jgi:hypothetical protein
VGSLEIQATKSLFNSISQYYGQEENIERFCLPLFMKEGSDYAINHVLESIKLRPSMTQIYASYLSKFIGNSEINDKLVEFMSDNALVDWQKIWIIAALLRSKPKTDVPIQNALAILRDAQRHDALRAVAAIFVGTYGNLGRRKALMTIFPAVSPYIQAAIYFSSRNWPGAERSNARASWGNLGELNSLLSAS